MVQQKVKTRPNQKLLDNLSRLSERLNREYEDLCLDNIDDAVYPQVHLSEDGRLDFLMSSNLIDIDDYKAHPIIAAYMKEFSLNLYIDKYLIMTPGVWNTFFFPYNQFDGTEWEGQFKEGTNRFIDKKIRLPTISNMLIVGSKNHEKEYNKIAFEINEVLAEINRPDRVGIKGYIKSSRGSRPVMNTHKINQVTICLPYQLTEEELRKDGFENLEQYFQIEKKWYPKLNQNSFITFYSLPFQYIRDDGLDPSKKQIKELTSALDLVLTNKQ